jgi:hypothetical protein
VVADAHRAVECLALRPMTGACFLVRRRSKRTGWLEVVSQTFASWNQIGKWLSQVEVLRQAA